MAAVLGQGQCLLVDGSGGLLLGQLVGVVAGAQQPVGVSGGCLSTSGMLATMVRSVRSTRSASSAPMGMQSEVNEEAARWPTRRGRTYVQYSDPYRPIVL